MALRVAAFLLLFGWLVPLLARHVATVRSWRDELQKRLGREATEHEWEDEMDRRLA